MEYLELFPACVQTHQTELDIDSLISFCYTLQRKHNKGVELSNLGGWQSGNIKNNPHLEFVKLLSEIQFATNIYHNKLQFKKEFKQELCNIWININGKGHLNEYHIHAKSALSGVFYLTDSKFPIMFKHPYEEMNTYYWDEEFIESHNNLNSGQWSVTPKKNTLLIFPPWLYHKVAMNKENSNRISISFNTVFNKNEWGEYS